jgi:hypothetical protein
MFVLKQIADISFPTPWANFRLRALKEGTRREVLRQRWPSCLAICTALRLLSASIRNAQPGTYFIRCAAIVTISFILLCE